MNADIVRERIISGWTLGTYSIYLDHNWSKMSLYIRHYCVATSSTDMIDSLVYRSNPTRPCCTEKFWTLLGLKELVPWRPRVLSGSYSPTQSICVSRSAPWTPFWFYGQIVEPVSLATVGSESQCVELQRPVTSRLYTFCDGPTCSHLLCVLLLHWFFYFVSGHVEALFPLEMHSYSKT